MTGLLDLPPELLSLVLSHLALDPPSLRAVQQTCTALAAATARASPLWRQLLASRGGLSSAVAKSATAWEAAFFCYWDDSYEGATDEAAFDPPLRKVVGWTNGQAGLVFHGMAAPTPVNDFPAGSFVWVDRGRSTPTAAASVGPRAACTVAGTLAAAAIALVHPALSQRMEWAWGHGSETVLVHHAIGVRLHPPCGSWSALAPPPPGAADAAAERRTLDEAAWVLAQLGATAGARRVVEVCKDSGGRAWSGHDAGELLEQMAEANPEPRGAPPTAGWERAFGPLRRLLGGRPCLCVKFGKGQMNPVGVLLLAQWAPDLALGLLSEVTHT